MYHKAAAGNGSIHNLDVPILLFGKFLCNAESESKVFSVGMGIVGWLTYLALRQGEKREAQRKLQAAGQVMSRPASPL